MRSINSMVDVKVMVSVVMPCFNEEENIEAAIRSVLNQTFADFELIVVDDCSSDGSARIIKAIAQEDARIRYLKNTENLGVAKTLNHGLSISKGKYIARLDADDACEPERLQKQVEYLEGHSNCIVCGSYADVYNGKTTVLQGNKQNDLKRYLVKNNPFVHSSVVFRKVIDNEPVCYPEVRGFEDYALWITLCNKGDFFILPEVLVHRRDINNFQTKETWKGFNKLKIYKMLRSYQVRATKETGFWAYGAVCILISTLKIIYTHIKNLMVR